MGEECITFAVDFTFASHVGRHPLLCSSRVVFASHFTSPDTSRPTRHFTFHVTRLLCASRFVFAPRFTRCSHFTSPGTSRSTLCCVFHIFTFHIFTLHVTGARGAWSGSLHVRHHRHHRRAALYRPPGDVRQVRGGAWAGGMGRGVGGVGRGVGGAGRGWGRVGQGRVGQGVWVGWVGKVRGGS